MRAKERISMGRQRQWRKKMGWGGQERRETWFGLNDWKSLCIIISQLLLGCETPSVLHAPHDSFHKGGWATFAVHLLYYLACSGPHDGFVPSDNPQKCHCDASWQNFFAVKVATNSKNGISNGTNAEAAWWRKTSYPLQALLSTWLCALHNSCFSYITVCCFLRRTPASFTACDRPALR